MKLAEIPVILMIAITVACMGGFIAVWMPLMPNRSYRLKVLIGCGFGILFLVASSAIKDFSVQVAAAYYIMAMLALIGGPWGKRREIAKMIRVESKGDNFDDPRLVRRVVFQIIAAGAVPFILLSVIFTDF
ncbi:hypothetical protein [Streptomyces sp. NBC_01304]|uniref:hypothetical protein n=1 Tax=Streptomyces sp. NBC_01304 TaxID=2903818 RepID=UPI002E0EBD15|nr:hypothetical protein OG430_41990 [Streptomyces sp. NBC_01304]